MSRVHLEIEERVISRIRERREAGRAKYGATMERDDLPRGDWLRHAQEEALDLAIYLEKVLELMGEGHEAPGEEGGTRP